MTGLMGDSVGQVWGFGGLSVVMFASCVGDLPGRRVSAVGGLTRVAYSAPTSICE